MSPRVTAVQNCPIQISNAHANEGLFLQNDFMDIDPLGPTNVSTISAPITIINPKCRRTENTKTSQDHEFSDDLIDFSSSGLADQAYCSL